ncbi:hypothetical protein AMAG_19959 [Allomyces macrogynus ATCC 38327]|uniref:Uncharacterized protein n=1 Tax=Allomyces macrogynus (strain ATCC 38327) TaxID=578462 RepID=A0A0L0T314_ALLM3|nr:hypothetical protein AMAG_19959 [Allomyces macrogynus ATCC 38327]|eukprot:KNE69102.1 hypothetical protein AMAG_19959 [Allomyces macrogynus ATCC 38327]
MNAGLYVDPPFAFLGHSKYNRHKQKYGLIGCGRFGQDGCVTMAIMNETQLITMVEYTVWRVFEVMVWLWETFGESTLNYATTHARRF